MERVTPFPETHLRGVAWFCLQISSEWKETGEMDRDPVTSPQLPPQCKTPTEVLSQQDKTSVHCSTIDVLVNAQSEDQQLTGKSVYNIYWLKEKNVSDTTCLKKVRTTQTLHLLFLSNVIPV